MIVRAPRPDRGFLIVANDVARDGRLSYRARGVLLAVLSRPDDWRTDASQLAREGKEGRDAIRSALRELEAAGYVIRRKVQGERGLWTTATLVFDSPVPPEVRESLARGTDTDADDKPAGHTDDWKTDVGEPAVGFSGPVLSTETNDRDEDDLNCPDASASRATKDIPDWRTEDRTLFAETIALPWITSDGTGEWGHGTWSTDVWYDALRRRTTKPIKWPGRYFDHLADTNGIDDYLDALGLERTLTRLDAA